MDLKLPKIYVSRIKRKKIYARGAFSRFIKLNKAWAVKCFDAQHARDSSFKRQKRAHKLGLAPYCGRRFQFKEPHGNISYGYVTQIAEKVLANEDSNERHQKYYEMAEQVAIELQRRGFKGRFIDDLHGYNIGFIGKKVVCINFYCG